MTFRAQLGLLLSLAILTGFLPALASANDAKSQATLIRDGDHVVFWGDSLTERQPWTRTVEHFIRTQHPDWKLRFTDLSVSGEIAANHLRMRRDLYLAPKPTLVIIFLGMNDGGYGPWSAELQDLHEHGLESMVRHAGYFGARVAIMSSIPYEADKFPNHAYTGVDLRKYPESIGRLAEGARRVADQMGVPYLDMFGEYGRVEKEWKLQFPDLVLSYDGIHPRADGYALIALSFLKLAGFSSKREVLRLDWNAPKRLDHESFDIVAAEYDVEMTRLPWLFENRHMMKLPAALFDEVADRWQLRLANYESSQALVLAGERPIGEYTRRDLAAGVDLLAEPAWGPCGERAQLLMELIRRKNELVLERRDKFPQLNNRPPAPGDGARFLDAEIDFLNEQIAAYAHPHRFVLSVVPENPTDSEIVSAQNRRHPLPRPDEVQLTFTVDTKVLKGLYVSERWPNESFIPPLALRGDFKVRPGSKFRGGFEPNLLNDEALDGDEEGYDGIYSLRINVKMSKEAITFFFNDGGRSSDVFESPIFRQLRQWTPQVVPLKDQQVHFGRRDLEELMERGLLRLAVGQIPTASGATAPK